MNFQNLKKIETAQSYIDIAFAKAKRKAELAKQKKYKEKIKKSQYVESIRVQSTGSELSKKIMDILLSFPNVDELDIFYVELIKNVLDYVELKKSLGSLNWLNKKINSLTAVYTTKITRCQHHKNIGEYRSEYYGRISSLLKQNNRQFIFLEECRKIMRRFPAIKTKIFTVAICGFPNIGKTTLISKLSTANPEINNYDFTTKDINIGYIFEEETNKRMVQLLDTPGTLNRLDKMNNVEVRAYIAIKYASDALIYVFDLSSDDEDDLKKQIKLYKTLKKENSNILIYLSKTDIIDKEIINQFKEKYPNAVTDGKIILKEILKKQKEYEKKIIEVEKEEE
jgi:nucleolar GTP-binding protein